MDEIRRVTALLPPTHDQRFTWLASTLAVLVRDVAALHITELGHRSNGCEICDALRQALTAIAAVELADGEPIG